MRLHPVGHCRAASQDFPASARSTKTLRAGRIDHVVPNLRMSAINAAIEFAAENDTAADAGADGHKDHVLKAAAGAPEPFAQRGRVGIVFHRSRHTETIPEFLHRIRAFPLFYEIGVPD